MESWQLCLDRSFPPQGKTVKISVEERERDRKNKNWEEQRKKEKRYVCMIEKNARERKYVNISKKKRVSTLRPKMFWARGIL